MLVKKVPEQNAIVFFEQIFRTTGHFNFFRSTNLSNEILRPCPHAIFVEVSKNNGQVCS
jgi:hypothetical protein